MARKFTSFTINQDGHLIYKKTGQFVQGKGVTVKGNTVYRNGRKVGVISTPDKKVFDKNRTIKKNMFKSGIYKVSKKKVDNRYDPIYEKLDLEKRLENLKNMALRQKNFKVYEKLRKLKKHELEDFFKEYDNTVEELGYTPPSKPDELESYASMTNRFDTFFNNLFERLDK